MTSTNKLAEKVRLSLKYEEAKRRCVSVFIYVESCIVLFAVFVP